MQKDTLARTDHSWGSWRVTREATCTAAGERTRTCKVCGQTQTDSIARAPHSWGDWEIITEATDHSSGTRAHTCQVCGTRETQDYDPEGTLRRGDSGDDVRALQEALICYGALAAGGADGSFGSGTEKAVQQAQTSEGLTADGVAWPETQARLGHVYGEWEVLCELGDFSRGVRQRVCTRCGHTETEEEWPVPTYKRGDKGDGVKDLQEALNAAGYDCGKADGSFGGKTEAAVSALEAANGIEADGIAWPGVMKLLGMAAAKGPDEDLPDAAGFGGSALQLTAEILPPRKLDYEVGEKVDFKWTLTNLGSEDLTLEHVHCCSMYGSEWIVVFSEPQTIPANGALPIEDQCTIPLMESWRQGEWSPFGMYFVAYAAPEGGESFPSNTVEFKLPTPDCDVLNWLRLEARVVSPAQEGHALGDKVTLEWTVRNDGPVDCVLDSVLTAAEDPLFAVWEGDYTLLSEGKNFLPGTCTLTIADDWQKMGDGWGIGLFATGHAAIELADDRAFRSNEAGFVFSAAEEPVVEEAPPLILTVTPKSGVTDVQAGDDVEFTLHVHNPRETDLPAACVRALDCQGNFREEYLDIALPAGGDVELSDHYTFTEDDAALHDVTLNWYAYVSAEAAGPAATKGIDYTVSSGKALPVNEPKLVLTVEQTSAPQAGYDIGDEVTFHWKLVNTGPVPCRPASVTISHDSGWTAILWSDAYVLSANSGNALEEDYTFSMRDYLLKDGRWGMQFMAVATPMEEQEEKVYYRADPVPFEFPQNGAEPGVSQGPKLVLDVQQTSPAKEGGYEEDDAVTFHWKLTNNGDADCELDLISVSTPDDQGKIVTDAPLKLRAHGAEPQSGDYTLTLDPSWVDDVSGHWEFYFRAQAKPTGAGIHSNDVPFSLPHAGDEPAPTGEDGEDGEPKLVLTMTQTSPAKEDGYEEDDEVAFHWTLTNIGDVNCVLESIYAFTPDDLGETFYGEPKPLLANGGNIQSGDGTLSLPGSWVDDGTGKWIFTFRAQGKQTGPGSTGETVRSNDVQFIFDHAGDEPVPTGGVSVVKKVAGFSKDLAGYQIGEVVHYEITVTNNTDAPILDVQVYDPLKGSNEDMMVDIFPEIAPGGSETAKFDYTVTGPDVHQGVIVNTASATWVEGDEDRDQSSNTVTVDTWGLPDADAFTVVKRVVSGPGPYAAYDTVYFEIDVTNNTGETVDYVPVYDFLNGDPVGVPVETIHALAPGETRTVQFEYTVQPEDTPAGLLLNVGGVRIDKGEKVKPDEYRSLPVEVNLIPDEPPVRRTPQPDPTPVPEETPVPDMTPIPNETPTPNETPVPNETPLPNETPIPNRTPEPNKTPEPKTTPKPEKTPVPETTPEPETTPVPETTPGPETTPEAVAADCCVRTLVGLGEGLAEYTQDYCTVHTPIFERAAALVNAAETEAERLEAWQQAGLAWTKSLNAEYDALEAAEEEAGKAVIAEERERFFRQIDARREALALEHPIDPTLVAMRISELLMNQTCELCYARHTAPAARVDSRLRENIAELPPREPEAFCLREVERTPTGARYLEVLCEPHRKLDIAAAALLSAATEENLAETWELIGQIWLMELDARTNARWLAATEADRPIIAAERETFGEWLSARKALLELFYPDRPATVREVLAGIIRDRVLDLEADME